MKILLVIDMQEGFRSENTEKVFISVSKFLRDNKSSFDIIVGSMFCNQKDSKYVSELNYYKMMANTLEYEIPTEIREHISLVYQKTGYESYNNLEKVLALKDGIDLSDNEYYICGVDTDACVLTTVMNMFNKVKSVKVIEDLCATSSGSDMHKSAIKILKRNIGESNIISKNIFNR